MRVQDKNTHRQLPWWRRHWPQLVIISVWLLLVISNYVPGTWLTGWDNLHPEWDPLYDLWRSFNAVWQEHQGVGLLGGMAHAADLPRQFFVLILSWFWPKSLIRYTLLFVMLLTGALGCFQLFTRLFTDQRQKLIAKLAALAAALFYLLNLGTVQNFYVAFEPFYWFYGLLPWLLNSVYRVWRTPDQRGWLQLTLLSFLAAPLAYLQTNFVVYALLLVIMGLAFLFSRRPKVKFLEKVRRLFLSASIVTLTNCFWLLPMFYFVLTGGSQTTINAQINQLSTREVSVQNQAYGNWRDILLLRGYWFAGQDYDNTDDNQDPIAFMQTWMSEPATEFFGYVFAGLLGVGTVYLLIYRRDYRTYGVILGFAAMCSLLVINHFQLDVLSQIFRSPYTKVVVPLSLLYSLLVGASFLFFARVLRQKLLLFTFAFYGVALGMYAIPALGGHFIYHNLRPTIPVDYEKLFAFMRTQDRYARTALLPAETVYGWQHNTWGYRGIGFYWFGMRQAMLNRTFDVWSYDNEEFYQELHYARLEGDGELFRRVLDKYDVRYLIYDQSIHRRGRDSDMFHQQWLDLIVVADCLEIHHSELIQVYDCGIHSDQYVSLPSKYTISNTTQFHQFYDPSIAGGSNYITGSEMQAIDLPFAYLYAREPDNDKITYHDEKYRSDIVLDADLHSHNYHEITIPSLLEATRASFLVSVDTRDDDRYLVSVQPLFTLQFNGEDTEVFPVLSFTAPALEDDGEIYFDFGSDYARLTPGEASNSAMVSLSGFDDDQVWRYFAAGKARARGVNINVDLMDTVELTVPAAFWDQWREPKTLTFNHPLETMTATIHTIPKYLTSFATTGAVNCDVIYRGEVDRQKYGDHGYSYRVSGHGSYCDTFYDSLLDSAKHSFFIRTDAHNYTGLPLTYYFWDINNQVQSWETMLSGDRVTQTFSLPAVRTPQETAYFDVHSANRSIAGEEAYNVLESTRAYIVPTHILGGITLRGRDASDNIANSLQLEKVTKSGTSQYRVQLLFARQADGLLVLNQGYHDGWQASINGQKLDHVHYDDWANAWLITPDDCPDGECTVIISYWPAWLGWIGLAISLSVAGASGVGLSLLGFRQTSWRLSAVNLSRVFTGAKIRA